MEVMKSQKRNLKRRSNQGAIGDVANCHPLTIASVILPTMLTSIVYFLMYDVSVFSDSVAYAQAGSLFDFYVLCSMSYLLSMSLMWLTGTSKTVKFLCVIMFVMVTDNIVMAVDSQNHTEWELLNTIDSYLQITCGVTFGLVILIWIISKLQPYVYRLLGYRYLY